MPKRATVNVDMPLEFTLFTPTYRPSYRAGAPNFMPSPLDAEHGCPGGLGRPERLRG